MNGSLVKSVILLSGPAAAAVLIRTVVRRDIPARVRRALGESGVRGTMTRVTNKVIDYSFDIRYGTDTSQWVQVADFGVNSPNLEHAGHYCPTRARQLRMLLNDLQLPRDGAFVDIGSGKGRVLLIASTHGFSRLVGVEISPRLCAIARANVDIYQRKIGTDLPIQIVESDAADFALRDDETVFFLYNPFQPVIIETVLQSIGESLRRRPRKVWLIYNNPVNHRVIDDSPIFVKCGEYRYPSLEVTLYATADG